MMYLFNPASASAPAGSVTDRVSVHPSSHEHVVQWRRARRTFEYILYSGANLVIVNSNDAVEQLPTYAERLFAHDAHGGPIAEQADLIERDALALFQTARHRVAVERLGADDARARAADALDVLAHAGDEPAPADGAKNGVEVLGVGELLEDLHADCALAGDDERVVVGRDEDEAVGGGEAGALRLGLVEVRAVQDDLGAEARDVAHFDRGGALRHNDGARDAEACAREGNPLRVVS